MTRIPISKSTCPYCGIKLEKQPSRKIGCTSCGKPIYVRTTVDRNQYLVTEDEVKRIEQEWTENTANRASFCQPRSFNVIADLQL